MEKSYKGCMFSLVGMILIVFYFLSSWRCCSSQRGDDTLSVDSIIIRDTVYIDNTDTTPKIKTKIITEYVSIPCPEPTNGEDSTSTAQVTLPVVQKEFSDDSTYTAYVSGLQYADWPRLDSITVRQREITNTVIKTITVQKKRSHWNFGVQAGYGYGLSYRGFEPYIGVGLQYSF